MRRLLLVLLLLTSRPLAAQSTVDTVRVWRQTPRADTVIQVDTIVRADTTIVERPDSTLWLRIITTTVDTVWVPVDTVTLPPPPDSLPPEPPDTTGGDMSVPSEPVYTAGVHTIWRDMRTTGAGSISALPGLANGTNGLGEHQYRTDGPGGLDVNRFLYYQTGCLSGQSPADANVIWSNGGWRPDVDIPNVRTMMATWYIRPQVGYQWEIQNHLPGGCNGGNAQKTFIMRREIFGGNAQRSTLTGASSGGARDTRRTNWGYPIARDAYPGGYRTEWQISYEPEANFALGQYMNYGEAGAASKAPYQISDGDWHRMTVYERRESVRGAGDGATGLWIDGYPVYWYDGADATRPEYGQVTNGERRFAFNVEIFGVHNRGNAQEQWIDAVGPLFFYPTSELADGPDPVNVQPVLLNAVPTIGAPLVVGGTGILPTRLNAVPVVGAPILIGGSPPTAIYPVRLEARPTIGIPTLTGGLFPTRIDGRVTIAAPSVGHGLEPTSVAAPVLPAPAVGVGVAIDPSSVDATPTVGDPDIGHGIEPAAVDASPTIPAPAIGMDLIEPDPVAASPTIDAPTITHGIAPVTVDARAVIAAPSLGDRITPSRIDARPTIGLPNIWPGPDVTAPPTDERLRTHARGWAIRVKIESPNADHLMVVEGVECEVEVVRESEEAWPRD